MLTSPRVTIALVRDIHQRSYFNQIIDPEIRKDGWVRDLKRDEWYSPDNVISITRFEARKWDGNNIKPGTLCERESWSRSNGKLIREKDHVIILNRNAAKRVYNVIDGQGRKAVVAERRLVPVMVEDQNEQG